MGRATNTPAQGPIAWHVAVGSDCWQGLSPRWLLSDELPSSAAGDAGIAIPAIAPLTVGVADVSRPAGMTQVAPTPASTSWNAKAADNAAAISG